MISASRPAIAGRRSRSTVCRPRIAAVPSPEPPSPEPRARYSLKHGVENHRQHDADPDVGSDWTRPDEERRRHPYRQPRQDDQHQQRQWPGRRTFRTRAAIPIAARNTIAQVVTFPGKRPIRDPDAEAKPIVPSESQAVKPAHSAKRNRAAGPGERVKDVKAVDDCDR